MCTYCVLDGETLLWDTLVCFSVCMWRGTRVDSARAGYEAALGAHTSEADRDESEAVLGDRRGSVSFAGRTDGVQLLSWLGHFSPCRRVGKASRSLDFGWV